jgi:hypothetical protein
MILKRSILALGALLTVGCALATTGPSERSDESLGSQQAAIILPSLTPQPCDWGGGITELLVADAWAACELIDEDFPVYFYSPHAYTDDYLQLVASEMANATGSQYLQDWYAFRTGQNNCDPAGGSELVAVDIPLTPVSETTWYTSQFHFTAQADYDLRSAGVNLCIAQHLRSVSPGASGADALLLSNADQRELTEVIRERSQMAMLQYAQLGVAFTTEIGEADDLSNDETIPLLQFWALLPVGVNPANPFSSRSISLAGMARDFATAVQLHTVVSEEILSLLARSGSARLPHQSAPAFSRADEVWGPSSWHQRLLASAFGGDPLVIEPNGPWRHPLLFGSPATSEFACPDFLCTGQDLNSDRSDWPTTNLPFVSTEIDEPQVAELLRLARRFDLVELRVNQSGSCRTISRGLSMDHMHVAVEEALRKQACEDPSVPDCFPAVPSPIDDDQTELWKQFRVRRGHVEKLVNLLTESLGPRLDVSADGLGCPGERFGALRVEGNLTEVVHGSRHYVKLDKDFDFKVRDLADSGTAFGAFGSLTFPSPETLLPNGSSSDQGFSNHAYTREVSPALCQQNPLACPVVAVPQGVADSAKRRMGILSSLAATRHMLFDSLQALAAIPEDSGKTNLNDYFSTAAQIESVIDAAIGPTSFSVKPLLDFRANDELHLGVKNNTLGPLWRVTIDSDPAKDSFWADDVETSPYVLAIPEDGWVSELAHMPGKSIFGRTLATLFEDTDAHPVGFLDKTVDDRGRISWVTHDGMPIGGPDGFIRRWSFIAVRATPDEFSGLLSGDLTTLEPDDVRVLGTNMVLGPGDVRGGQYYAQGGALGDWVTRQAAPDPLNPTRHGYDGFGIWNGWVPPFNAELLGSTAGTSVIEHYMAGAKAAAQDATQAVNRAMDGLLEKTKDEADLSAAAARSTQGIKEASESLCGSQDPHCDVAISESPLQKAWYPSLGSEALDLDCSDLPTDYPPAPNASDCADPPQWPEPIGGVLVSAQQGASCSNLPANDTALAKKMMGCFVQRRLQEFLQVRVPLAAPVSAQIGASAVPTFSEFSGGKLQSALIEQWRAVKSPDERFEALLKSRDAADSKIDVAAAVISKQEHLVQLNCGGVAMALAFQAGFSFSIFPSWSAGPLIAQQQKCSDLLTDSDVVVKEETAAIKDAFMAVASAAIGLTDAQAAIVQSGATMNTDISTTRLAVERAALEETLTAEGQVTSFGLYRRYRDYDLWRAKALVEDARRYALSARRAVEARYVVDLSTLTAPEPFVASPSSWADAVYEYDLSLPTAVGLQVATTPQAGAIYTNKVEDYVRNLQDFVNGFAADRPSAVAEQELDVINLPGLGRGQPIQMDAFDENDNPVSVPIYPSASSWQVACPVTGAPDKWVGVPMAEAGGIEVACGGPSCGCAEPINFVTCQCAKRPTRARLTFSLDPWGRFNGSVVAEPYANRYNGRWDRLAINLVGTAVRDCSLASDPLGCYGEGFLRYNLRHVGRPWVTDFAGAWRWLSLPPGNIEAGKALAAERWLEPLTDGWESSFISAIARSEFSMRPLGGQYELELMAGPDVILENIERVQVLVGSHYWVRQR